MNKKVVKLTLSILMACCLALISFSSVVEANQEGGQVSVPGKISFETEDSSTTSSSTDQGQKKPTDSNEKKYYSVLPKTGEAKSIMGIVGVIFMLGVGIVYYKKEQVSRNEK